MADIIQLNQEEIKSKLGELFKSHWYAPDRVAEKVTHRRCSVSVRAQKNTTGRPWYISKLEYKIPFIPEKRPFIRNGLFFNGKICMLGDEIKGAEGRRKRRTNT